MSSLTTTSINTANGSTNLTLGTGNTSGPAILVTSGTNVTIRANTSANVFIANSTAIRANAAMTVANTLTVSSNLIANVINGNTITGNITFSGVTSFSGNVGFSGIGTFSANVVAPRVNATAMSLGDSSIATQGFTTLPNGLVLNWGSASVTTLATTITFSRAFSAAPYSITIGNRATDDVWITTSNSTTFTADTDVNQSIYWMAIGPA